MNSKKKVVKKSSFLKQCLWFLTLPIRSYYRVITSPIPFLLHFQLVAKDSHQKISHHKHACNIKEIDIPIVNDKNQKIALEGICIEPHSLKKSAKKYRTLIYTPGSFALIKQNCVSRLIRTAEYLNMRIITFNNEGCGNSPGKMRSIQDLRSSYVKAIKSIYQTYQLATLNIWSHSNGAYLHLSTIKSVAESLPKNMKVGTNIIDRTHVKSDLLGPCNFVLNTMSCICIGFTITLTLYPIFGHLVVYTLDELLQLTFAISATTVVISSLFPKQIGQYIWRFFTLHSRIDNEQHAKEALKTCKRSLGNFISISHDDDEIIGKEARFNITKLKESSYVKSKHIDIPATANIGSTLRDPCDINHNNNLCGELNDAKPPKSLLHPVLECINKSDLSKNHQI